MISCAATSKNHRQGVLGATAIVATSIWLLIQPAYAQSRVALVIGNGSYEKVPELPNPPRDAADIGRALERLNFKVTQVKNATASEMRKAVVDFGRTAEGAEMAIVFYAGHGMEVGGENWLIPISAELRSDADIESEAVSLRSINLQVSKARQLGLVILDACRNNPFAAKMKRSISIRAVPRGLAPTEPTDNVLVAYAARDGTTASDGDGKNSPFTTALLRHIETPGLEISFLFRRVRDDVMAATKREQQPFVYGSLSKEEIYLRAPLSTSATPRPGPAVLASPEDERFWQAIQSSTTTSLFEEYVRRYPKGSHAAEARQRIKDLKSKEVAALTSAKPLANDTTAAAKGNESSATSLRDRNLFGEEEARKVASIGAAQELVLPVFSIDAAESDVRRSNARFVGVWSSKLGWSNGAGRNAMVIIRSVSDTGLARGYYLWGPPTKGSPTNEAAGNNWFAEYIVDNKFTIKTVPEVSVQLGEKNVIMLSSTLDTPAYKGGLTLDPIWQLVRTPQDIGPAAKDARGADSAAAKPADRNSFTDEDVRKVTKIGAAQKLDVPKFTIAAASDGPLAANSKFVGVWSSKHGWNGKGRYAMVIITEVSVTGLARGYYLWGPPVKESWTRHEAGYKWFSEYIVNDRFSIGGTEVTARLDKNVLTLSAFRKDKPSETSRIELRAIWQLARMREEVEPSTKRNQASRQETAPKKQEAARARSGTPPPANAGGSTMEDRYRACRKLVKGFAQREACARTGAI